MSPPKSTRELAAQIEALVAGYVAEGHRAAQQAVERAFSRASTAANESKPTSVKPSRRASGKRRSAEELVGLSERLYSLIRERPGESMANYAAQLGSSPRALERPRLRLERDGRIRSVGERQHARYFPSAAGKARVGGAA